MDGIGAFTLAAGLIGGLAMFLYGMSIMSGGLTKASGGRLELTLSRITDNPWVAYLFGVGVTALVQSSSASTVMVVGLVNSGIMSLAEAANIILGANLGTTFTAWLLSLNAISSDNFWINLLKPASFTPFLALVGIALLMFSKSDKRKNIGTVLMGFAVLMFGMNMMSDAVSPLKDIPAFRSFLTTFSNPLIGFLVGITFTMIIQSSAGTIGVVQALSRSVRLTYGMALPVVVGAEVGTCITAILSSVGAGKNGRRTALIHLYFNVLKAGVFMVVFYTLNEFMHFAFLEEQAGMVGVASIHTLLNLVATPLMVPASGVLVQMALVTIPIDELERREAEERSHLTKLDPLFLKNPPFALEQARETAVVMARFIRDGLFQAIDLIHTWDETAAAEVEHMEQRADRYEDQLGSYLVQINNHHLTVRDSRTLSILLHCITDLERISDHALNIAQTARTMQEKNETFSPKAMEEIDVFSAAIREIVTRAFEVFAMQDAVGAHAVEPLEEVIDGLHMEIKRRHVRRLRKGKCTIELGFALSDLGTDYERIADHCSNIAVSVIEVSEGVFETHEYLGHLRTETNPEFISSVEEYGEKYKLPVLKRDREDEELAEPAPQEGAEPVIAGSDKPRKKKSDKGKKKQVKRE